MIEQCEALRKAARQALTALENFDYWLKRNTYCIARTGYEEAITALREALKPNREGKYYYKDNACTAANADSPDCICWHDKALAEQAAPVAYKYKESSPETGEFVFATNASIEAAVLAEREACAKVCEEIMKQGEDFGYECAAAIRERSANARARGMK